MKLTAGIASLLLLAASAAAQDWGSPGPGRMSAAYDPASGAVLMGGQAAEAPPRIVDHHITQTQATVYQPPGRVYAVEDRFGAAPQPGLAWGTPAVVPPPATAYAAAPAYAGVPAPTLAPGYATPNYCPPVDPYACAPVYAPPPLAPVNLFTTRPAYAEIEGRFGDPAEVLQGNLMLPFWQQPSVFWFLDIRGLYDDERAGEGNFGVARRELLPSGLITSVYAFYDIRHTTYDNNFQQGMVGFEMMTLEWEYRVNGYLPFSGTQATGLNAALLDENDNIVVRQGLERAYFGMDAEYGFLLSPVGQDNEYRAYIGGYWFDTNETGFPTIAGPRARLEGRCYDLPYLGAGSRFTYGISYQWDDVRESQWIASANLRIPFGGGTRAASKLSPIERQMLSALRRDEAIVTGSALGPAEQAVISSTGAVATNVTVVNNGATAVADVGAGGDIVVVTSDINIGATGPIALNPNQFVGGQFQVAGQNSGAAATFGRMSTVSGGAGDNVFQLADNATITGLNISGGDNGVAGNNVTGFTISGNSISGAADAGIRLQNVSGGAIVGNRLNGGGASSSGLVADTLTGVTEVRDNTFANFADDGARIDQLAGGQFSGNTASGNGDDGFQINTVAGGVVSGNQSQDNGGAGFEFTNLNGGLVTNNRAGGNGGVGFGFTSFVTGGSVTGNFAEGSGASGFDFATVSNGIIRQNTSSGNGADGFQIDTLSGGDVQFNLAEQNTDDGFQIASFIGGVFSNNTASSNGSAGFDITGAGGVAADNSGSGNASNDFYP